MFRTLLLTATLGLLAACASTHASDDGALRVGLYDYRSKNLLELVNEAHTGRIDQYSEVRENAGRKVQSNEVMAGLVEYLRDNGFTRLALAGRAPREAGEKAFWAMEIEDGQGVAYLLPTRALTAEDLKASSDLKNAFLEIYNHTYGLQAVKVKQGEIPFKTPERPQDRTQKEPR